MGGSVGLLLDKLSILLVDDFLFRLHAVNVLTLWCSSCAGQKRPFFYYNEMNVLYFSSIFIYLTFCLFLGYFIELNYISEIVVIHLTPF